MKTKCSKNELNIKVLPSNGTFLKGAPGGLRCKHFKTTE